MVAETGACVALRRLERRADEGTHRRVRPLARRAAYRKHSRPGDLRADGELTEKARYARARRAFDDDSAPLPVLTAFERGLQPRERRLSSDQVCSQIMLGRQRIAVVGQLGDG